MIMTTTTRFLPCLFGLVAAAIPLSGCNDTPATVVVGNGYPASPDSDAAATVTIYKLWWTTTLIADPVAPEGVSPIERTVPGSDYAYALLAPGWSPESGAPPAALIAARSAERLSVARGARLEIVVSDHTFVGNCAAGKPLDADSAALIVERIFPGAFAGARYDPATCVTSAAAGDAAAPDGGGTDAGGE
jgi:hypothetical protein